MAFLEKLKSLKIFGGDEKKKSKNLKFVTYHQDPLEVWEIVKELGDGAFGKVYMVNSEKFCVVFIDCFKINFIDPTNQTLYIYCLLNSR